MPIVSASTSPRAGRTALNRVRLARTVALAVILAIGIVNLYWAVTGWTLSDAAAYWNAAMRLRDGGQLYPVLPNVDASDVYRYAPWFAWAVIPVTYLPVQLAGALWSLVLLAASGWALLPLVRARAWLLLALFAPILVGISAVGNVQALIVAALAHGLERRSGPLWIALAASLKITPLAFALVYAGRREWRRFAAACALTGLLWAPALLYDLRGYATEAGQAASLFAVPVLYAGVIAIAIGVTLALARSRAGWLAAATTVVLALPRLFVYDVSFVLLGIAHLNGAPGSR
jgi:Glycosyltransferase family 87